MGWNVLSTEFRVQNIEEQGLRGSLPCVLYNDEPDDGGAGGLDPVVRLRGLPWKTTPREIAEFFSDLRIAPNGVHIVHDANSRPSGEAFAEFETHADAVQALQKHKQYLGPRFVEVYATSFRDMGFKIGGRSGPPMGSKRDALVLVTLERLIRPGPHQAAVVALQEVTPGLIAALEPLLESESWAAGPGVYSSRRHGFDNQHHQDTVLLYRTAALTLESVELHGDVFSDGKKLVVDTLVPAPARAAQLAVAGRAACVSEDRAAGTIGKVRVVAGKIKGTPPVKPTKDGLWISRAVREWAGFMATLCPETGRNQAHAGTVTVCLGDFNFLEPEVLEVCRQASAALAPCPHAAAADAYPTNPNPAPWRPSERGFHGPAFGPKHIDHVLVDSASAATGLIQLLAPDRLLPGLSSAVEVLRCSGGEDVPAWPAGESPPGPVPPWEISPDEAVASVLSWKRLAAICDTEAIDEGVAGGLGSPSPLQWNRACQARRLLEGCSTG